MAKKEIVKQQATAVAEVKKQSRGFEEGVSREELIIPRAKLLQALSPEVTAGKFAPGRIINSVLQSELPQEFIPIFKFTNWIRFNPRDNKSPAFDSRFAPGSVIWRTADASDPRVIAEAKFGEDGTRPLATQFINFFSYFPSVDMPVVVSFCNTSLKAGKQLISIARFVGGDMFSHKYKLTTRQVQSPVGTYFVLDVAKTGVPTDAEYKTAETWWEEFSAKELKIHEEDQDSMESTAERPF